MFYRDLNGNQSRQAIDVEQVYRRYAEARRDFAHRFAGSIAWKTVRGRRYLYRKRGSVWRSLGPHSAATEDIDRRYRDGRVEADDRLAGLAARLDEMAPVNKAMQLARMPLIAARVLRAVGEAGLSSGSIALVGTNALFAYERLAGVQIESGHLATGDVDLLFDARARLDLAAADVTAGGLLALLRKVDRSFAPTGPGSFRAANRSGYLVDLIQPLPPSRMKPALRSRIGRDVSDLSAVAIEGLIWLVNSPKLDLVVIDERGYPVSVVVTDPRIFALHKLWVSEREDRDPLQRRRDRLQAELVAHLVATRLPHLTFDDPALAAVPLALRRHADRLIASPPARSPISRRTTPDW